jgi:hypothetical protein
MTAPSNSAFREAYLGVRTLETAANYAKADQITLGDVPRETTPAVNKTPEFYYTVDQEFWERAFSDSPFWGTMVSLHGVAISEWVARVPGLFFKPESEMIRQVSPAAIERSSETWIQYQPWGKSQKVMGGIGTLRLAPMPDGSRLLCVTGSMNASTGIPVLVMPEILERFPAGLEGQLISLSARWQPMSIGWASQFPSLRGIPRGYLVIENPSDFRLLNQVSPTRFHPFTIMEYQQGSALLYDFAYATADTGDSNHRRELEEFFERYKNDFGRHGEYLIAADMYEPLWDAKFNDPAELRKDSQLELLEARVREHLHGQTAIDTVLEVLGTTSTDEADLRRHSLEVGIEPALWLGGATLAKNCSNFLAHVLEMGHEKFEALIEVLAKQNPAKFV